MKTVAEMIPGYGYGKSDLAPSPVSLGELEQLKITVGFTTEDERYLRMAGEVLGDQTRAVVLHWRSQIIAQIPHLARHSRAADGSALPDYLAASNLRFEQWILDTCLRTYDRAWLDYQHEIAQRHTSAKKNRTDGVESTAFVPLRDVVGFVAVLNDTMRPYLAKKGHVPEEVDGMHRAWCRSIQLQIALWGEVVRRQRVVAGGIPANVNRSLRSRPTPSALAPSSSAGAPRRFTQNVGKPNVLAPAASQPAKGAKRILARGRPRASTAS